jgi:dTDP-4-amino-4,6-dideoxygalactose transaminase
MIPVAKPIIGEEEIEAVVAVLRSGMLVQGRITERLEEQFAAFVGTRHAVAVSNGTTALHLALLAHGVGPGDEVITTPFSFIATANSVLYTGARPVFADISEDTFNIDPDLIEAKVTARTKAIIPVHLYGHPADMAAIANIASRHGLFIVEDAAQAHGAAIDGRAVGSFGTGCFSFYATKNMITAEGGMVTTDDGILAERLRMLRNHGQRERYRHEILGYNFRLTDLQAAIGLAQLARLEAMTARRIANAGLLDASLPDSVGKPRVRLGCRHVYHQYTIRVREGRDELARLLREAGIGTGIHYPVPIHEQKLYLDLGYREELPVAEKACREVLSLPVHPAVGEADIAEIAGAVSRLAMA